jgi:hypothetical protein
MSPLPSRIGRTPLGQCYRSPLGALTRAAAGGGPVSGSFTNTFKLRLAISSVEVWDYGGTPSLITTLTPDETIVWTEGLVDCLSDAFRTGAASGTKKLSGMVPNPPDWNPERDDTYAQVAPGGFGSADWLIQGQGNGTYEGDLTGITINQTATGAEWDFSTGTGIRQQFDNALSTRPRGIAMCNVKAGLAQGELWVGWTWTETTFTYATGKWDTVIETKGKLHLEHVS